MGKVILMAGDGYQHITGLELTSKNLDVMTTTYHSDPAYQKGSVFFNPSDFIKVKEQYNSGEGMHDTQSNFFHLYSQLNNVFGFRGYTQINLNQIWDMTDIEEYVADNFKGNVYLYLCKNSKDSHAFSTCKDDNISSLCTIDTKHYVGSFVVAVSDKLSEQTITDYLNQEGVGRIMLHREYSYSYIKQKYTVWSRSGLSIKPKELGVLLNLKYGEFLEELSF